MSNLEDRKQALREQAYPEPAAKAIRQLELKAERRIGQGEFLGDMIGGFGAFAGGRTGRIVVAASQLTIILCVGAMLIMVLAPVA